MIDLVPIFLIAGIAIALSFAVDPTLGTLLNLLTIPYALMIVLVWPATKGWTPGKKMLRLRIYSDQTRPGEGLGWKVAGLRFAGYLVNSFTMGIGYLLIAFTSKKQGLHDLIAKTYVGRLPG
ncbi:MAG: RDD family protein [Holophagales bacterium]|nr:RDD family protein [Holophagales bacterium]